jgi:N-acetylmuramoyl-L-alanine amidase
MIALLNIPYFGRQTTKFSGQIFRKEEKSMASIYSFLQKRKLHESQHGIIMVITAYVLSILMLALGSDVFYNINSAAAGIKTNSEEETKESDIAGTPELPADDTSQILMSDLVNPYCLTQASIAGLNKTLNEDTEANSNTVWLLGNAMNGAEFDNLMVRMGSAIPDDASSQVKETAAKKAEAAEKKTETAKKTDESKDIKSFSVEVGANDTVITISKNEVSMLERIVEAEASGEDAVGKILVVNVIFNRIVDDEFPDTVEEVIFQKSHGDYQFSPVESGRYWDVKISKATKKAVQRALEGEDYSKGALYFVARKRTSSESVRWFDENLKWLFKHGGHEFYK